MSVLMLSVVLSRGSWERGCKSDPKSYHAVKNDENNLNIKFLKIQ